MIQIRRNLFTVFLIFYGSLHPIVTVMSLLLFLYLVMNSRATSSVNCCKIAFCVKSPTSSGGYHQIFVKFSPKSLLIIIICDTLHIDQLVTSFYHTVLTPLSRFYVIYGFSESNIFFQQSWFATKCRDIIFFYENNLFSRIKCFQNIFYLKFLSINLLTELSPHPPKKNPYRTCECSLPRVF